MDFPIWVASGFIQSRILPKSFFPIVPVAAQLLGVRQQRLVLWGQDAAATHVYTASKLYILHAMGGAQFKWQGGSTGTETSSSYECCADNQISATVTPQALRQATPATEL